MVLEILFFTFSKTDIWFEKRELVQETYTAAETLSTIIEVEIIDKEKFAIAALNADNKIFEIYVVALAKPMTNADLPLLSSLSRHTNERGNRNSHGIF